MSTARFCSDCGTPNTGGRFCSSCGRAFDAAKPSPAQEPGGTSTVLPNDGTVADESELWRGAPDALLSPMAARTTTYSLNAECLNITSGLVGKRGESIELYRVKDVTVKKGLKQRARGVGDVQIVSSDQSAPRITLESVPDPDTVAALIRQLSSAARRLNSVISHENI